MRPQCDYCDSLFYAIERQNFCSNSGDDIRDVESNAFYFKSSHLHSGDHISRLTLRTISQGYQYHKVDQKDYLVNGQKYLVVNEGQAYRSEIEAPRPVEGLVVAFGHSYLQKAKHFIHSDEGQLLDEPFKESPEALVLEQQTYALSEAVTSRLARLRLAIVSQIRDRLFYEELFHQLLLLMLRDKSDLHARIHSIKAKKQSTKIEMFKRLSRVREYLDAHTSDPVSLEELSKIAALSPYHLLRSFKAFYHITPHQYLLEQRLKRAQYLLLHSDLTIQQIGMDSGFENKSSFSRFFKKNYHLSPSTYREGVLSGAIN